MCLHFTHFLAHHNDRKLLTLTVISEFKVHMKCVSGQGCARTMLGELSVLLRPLAELRRGKGIESEENGKKKEGKGRRGGEGTGEGKEKMKTRRSTIKL